MKPFIENKNILILGGAGFIGSHLCEELVKRGDNVVCVDNFVSSDVENIRSLLEYPNFEFIRHDIAEDLEFGDLPGLKKFKVEVQGFQEIYNLACPTAPKDYSKFPVKTAIANSVGVVNSLEWAKKYKARYLLTSTSAVYGKPPADGTPVKENYYGLLDFLGPRAGYNEGKRFAETLVTTYQDAYQLNTSIARIFSTYGPRMLQHSGRQVPDFIRSAADDKDIEIAGDEESVLTFCYVKDVVEGIIALMASEISEPINIGSEQALTMTAVAQKVIELLNSKSTLSYTNKYAYTMQPAIPDISKAKEELNWFPLVSIEEGLKAAAEFYKATAFLHRPTIRTMEE
ncbi:MAG: NAD-dependent epimerase/dehydratase family protein [Candidatus Komeilibacteria bacterium]|jgi:UDP-glucuronate decarboxylase|nr:NAD-dependent epimerase/dehydratase family protein [Candidatus Komeilibacteria bacterium]MBT4448064.1 NAD-dependent epimerase/dehydratase family protein [Candidatus Komeilibacteria bacterium]